jgi:uncharacterized membrane protein
MRPRAISILVALGVLLGAAIGAAVGWVAWGNPARAARERVAALENAATQVQEERDHLRRELADLVRERREMATTAEHLRAQVEQELERLEALSSELTPPDVEAAPAPPPTP